MNMFFFSKLYETFADLADFTTVYTEEAHPTEADDFKNFVDIKIHRLSIEELLIPKLLNAAYSRKILRRIVNF